MCDNVDKIEDFIQTACQTGSYQLRARLRIVLAGLAGQIEFFDNPAIVRKYFI